MEMFESNFRLFITGLFEDQNKLIREQNALLKEIRDEMKSHHSKDGN